MTQIQRLQRTTLDKHGVHILHIGRIERTEIDSRQIVAIAEHRTHVRHLGGGERTQVKIHQRLAVVEHESHIPYIGGAEMAQVKILKCITAVEHTLHTRHIVRHEVLHAFYLRQGGQIMFRIVPAAEKHIGRRIEIRVLHRLVNDDLLYLVIIARETAGARIFLVVDLGRLVVQAAHIVIIVNKSLGVRIPGRIDLEPVAGAAARGLTALLEREITRMALFIRMSV